MDTIGVRLKKLRGPSSQKEMADVVGVKQQNWARWESGTVTPSAEMIMTICQKHNCSADWLFGLTDSCSVGQNNPNKRCRSGNVSSPELLQRRNNSEQTDWRARALAAEAKLVTFRHLAEDVLKAL